MQLKIGDVFIIGALKDNLVTAQIIAKERHKIYIVVFGSFYKTAEEINTDKVIHDKIIIVARTLDPFFKMGRWKVIGNNIITKQADIFPNYKIETNNGVFITNFDRQIIRKCSPEEEKFYFYYNEYSPAFVVSAIKAFYGEIPMDKDYEKLTYEFIRSRSNILN